MGSRQRQTINDALMILGHIQILENYAPDQVERLHQSAATPIETTLARDHGKQITMLLPLTEHFGFQIPVTTPANQRYASNSLSRYSDGGPGRLNKGAILSQISSTITYIQVQNH
jgi:hypothetical protein